MRIQTIVVDIAAPFKPYLGIRNIFNITFNVEATIIEARK